VVLVQLSLVQWFGQYIDWLFISADHMKCDLPSMIVPDIDVLGIKCNFGTLEIFRALCYLQRLNNIQWDW